MREYQMKELNVAEQALVSGGNSFFSDLGKLALDTLEVGAGTVAGGIAGGVVGAISSYDNIYNAVSGGNTDIIHELAGGVAAAIGGTAFTAGMSAAGAVAGGWAVLTS